MLNHMLAEIATILHPRTGKIACRLIFLAENGIVLDWEAEKKDWQLPSYGT